MSDTVVESKEVERVECRLAAVVEGENDIDDGVVKNIGLKGLYMRLHNSSSLRDGERVRIVIYEQRKSWRRIIELHARVVRIDSRGLDAQFLPMRLSNYLKLQSLVDLMSIETAKQKMQQISPMLIGSIYSKLGMHS